MYPFYQLIIIFFILTLLPAQNSQAHPLVPGNPEEIPRSSITDEEMEKIKEEWEKLFPTDKPGEEDLYRAERLLFSATGSLKPLRLAPSVATVITKEEIEEIGAISLDEVLETVPGLHVVPSGINFFSSNYSIRGILTQINPEVLLLINSVPFTRNYTGGRPQTFRMPVSMISRIEIVRGPASAIYGADAFSGIINVITKDNFEIDGTQTGVRYGSFDTHNLWLQHGGQYGGWDVWAGFETQKSKGDRGRLIEQDRVPAPMSNTPGHLDTKYEFWESHIGIRKNNFTLKLYGSWHHDNAAGPGGTQSITYTNSFDGREMLADLQWRDRQFTNNWDIGFQLYSAYFKTDNYLELFPSNFLSLIGNPIAVDQYSAGEFTSFYKGFTNHNLRFSAGTKFFDTEAEAYQNFIYNPGLTIIPFRQANPDEIYINPQNRSLYYFSIQDEWQLAPHWSFTGGVRFDDYSDFGSTFNPRAALVWETRYDLTTKLLYGSAFRAPSFTEQYAKNNPVITANPDVAPQTIDTYELAFNYQPNSRLQSSLNIFYYKAKELIETQNGLVDNYGIQKGQGFEIDINWSITDTLKVRSNYAFQRSRNKTTDSLVPNTPENQFYLNTHWEFMSQWSLDSQFYWVADRHRSTGDIRDDIDDYELVNLTLRRKNFVKNLDCAVAARNIFNEDAREASPYDANAVSGAYIPNDYPMEGRSIWGEIRYSF